MPDAMSILTDYRDQRALERQRLQSTRDDLTARLAEVVAQLAQYDGVLADFDKAVTAVSNAKIIQPVRDANA